MPKIIHIWPMSERTAENSERRAKAVESWQATYEQGGNWISTPIEPGMVRDCSRPPLNDPARHPFLKDAIRAGTLRAKPDDLICITRADSQLFPRVDPLPHPCYSHRVTVLNGRTEWHPSVDFFLFSREWWEAHRSECPDLVMGEDHYWSQALAELLKQHGANEVPDIVHREWGGWKPVPKSFPPHVTYNEQMVKEWFASHNLSLTKPTVAAQKQLRVVNRQALMPYGYNGSLIRHGNALLLAYRYHPRADYSTELAIATLDGNLNVIKNQPLIVNDEFVSHEDPRLFEHQGVLWMCYVCSTYPQRPIRAVVKYARLFVEQDEWRVGAPFQVKYGNQPIEKNWIFFDHEGRLFCIYQCDKEQIVLEIKENEVAGEFRTPALVWKYGVMRGGTSPVMLGDSYQRFFHSHLLNESPPNVHRYYVGTMRLQPEPPFKQLSICEKPLLIGAEDNCDEDGARYTCPHHKCNVVFPVGLIRTKTSLLVSCGINDSQIAVVRIPENEL